MLGLLPRLHEKPRQCQQKIAMGNECEPTVVLENQINCEILVEAKVEPIAMVMGRGIVAWFGHARRRDETERIRAVAEIKIWRSCYIG